jgi:hypothetical protein
VRDEADVERRLDDELQSEEDDGRPEQVHTAPTPGGGGSEGEHEERDAGNSGERAAHSDHAGAVHDQLWSGSGQCQDECG